MPEERPQVVWGRFGDLGGCESGRDWVESFHVYLRPHQVLIHRPVRREFLCLGQERTKATGSLGSVDEVGQVCCPLLLDIGGSGSGHRRFPFAVYGQFAFGLEEAALFGLIDEFTEPVEDLAEPILEPPPLPVVPENPGRAEGKFLHEFCSAVLDRGQTHRVSVHGLALPDSLEYLPVQAFAAKRAGATRASLRDEYLARDGEEQKNFKD